MFKILSSFIFIFLLYSCAEDKSTKLHCPLDAELKINKSGKCPEYFTRLWDATLILEEAQNSYVNKRKKFRIDNTYNHVLLNKMVEDEKTLNTCLEATPLGNKKERSEFFKKWRTSSLRAVHETDRYFQDKLADHYLHNADCFKEAEIKLQRLIDKQ